MAKIVEVTNPVTGQPTQVDQLDHTAQQIDEAISRALPGGYYDKWVSQLPGQNLLDNSVFLPGCLVDQRQGRVVKPNTTYYSDNQLTTSAGTTSAYVTAYRYATGTASGVNYASFKLEDSDTAPTYYAAPANVVRGYVKVGYTLDRWYLNLSSVSAGGIQIQKDCIQFISNGGTHIIEQSIEGLEDISGKTITLSVLIDTFGLVSVTTALGSIKYKYFNGSTASDGYMSVEQKSSGIVSIVIGSNGTTRKVYAIKLELGDTQTLAHQDENGVWQLNALPNYADTLARCQRYLYIANGIYPCMNCDSNNGCFFSINIPVKMRTTPSVILPSSFIVLTGKTNQNIYTFGNYQHTRGNTDSSVQINLKDSVNNQYSLDYSLFCNDNPIYISAEL